MSPAIVFLEDRLKECRDFMLRSESNKVNAQKMLEKAGQEIVSIGQEIASLEAAIEKLST